MKAFGYLLFIAFILSNVKSDYSINILLDFLQEKGYYNIIQHVKIIFGDNIAISVCKSFIETIHCEEVVRVYMIGSPSKAPTRRDPSEEDLIPEEDLFPKEDLIPGEEDLIPEAKNILKKARVLPQDKPLIIVILYNYDYLIQNMSEEEILKLIHRILREKYNLN